MILRKRTVELLSGADLPADLQRAVDRVLVLGGLPCSMIATRGSQAVALAVGIDRAAALRRLACRLAGDRRGAASLERRLPA